MRTAKVQPHLDRRDVKESKSVQFEIETARGEKWKTHGTTTHLAHEGGLYRTKRRRNVCTARQRFQNAAAVTPNLGGRRGEEEQKWGEESTRQIFRPRSERLDDRAYYLVGNSLKVAKHRVSNYVLLERRNQRSKFSNDVERFEGKRERKEQKRTSRDQVISPIAARLIPRSLISKQRR